MSDAGRKAVVFLLMFILILDIPIIVFSCFTDSVVLNSDFYKEEFEKVGLYSFFQESITNMASENVEEGQTSALAQYITEPWVKEQMNRNIEKFVDYLRGDSLTYEPTLATQEIKEAVIADQEGTAETKQELRTQLDEALPDEVSTGDTVEVPTQLLMVTRNISTIKYGSIGLGAVVLVLTFFVYKEKPKFFKKVGKRIAVSGAISLAFLGLFYWKIPDFLTMLPDALPAVSAATLFQDILTKLLLYNFAIFAVGIALYATSFAVRKNTNEKRPKSEGVILNQ